MSMKTMHDLLAEQLAELSRRPASRARPDRRLRVRRRWGRVLEKKKASEALQNVLDDEHAANRRLTRLVGALNKAAIQASMA